MEKDSKYILGRKKHEKDGVITYSDRTYMSYSSWSLWKKSKSLYRKRYYLNEQPANTKETLFGKDIALMMEESDILSHPVLSKIPIHSHIEYPIEIIYKGLHILGYLDLFNEEDISFSEIKTGHLSTDGEVPWDHLKVKRHEQLVFYSFLLQQKFGKVNRECHLHWLETAFIPKTVEFAGHTLTGGNELQLTGKIETFSRKIFQWERDYIAKDILKVAQEISDDYKLWQDENK